jgi:hypothetical protein
MSIRSKLSAVALAGLATGSVFALGSGEAAAAVCNGTWQTIHSSAGVQLQCYYLPTVSNGRVTGLAYKQNVRPIPGASIGWHGSYYGPHHK